MKIFVKQFIACVAILLVSYVLIVAMLIFDMNKFLIEQHKTLLMRYSKDIADNYAKIYYVDDISKINFGEIEKDISVLDRYVDSDFILVDTDFKVLIKSNRGIAKLGDDIETSKLEGVMNGNVVFIDDGINSLFGEETLTVAYPLKAWDKVVGAVIVNSWLSDIHKTLKEIIFIIISSLCISMLLALCSMYIYSKYFTKPIIEMSRVSRAIAQGNFSNDVKIIRDDELGDLANSLNAMAKSLRDNEKNRTKFISNISHDIRSPLTSINGFLQAICDGTVPESKHKYYLQIILEETKRLKKLAENILDITKIKNSEVILQRSLFDVNEIIEKVIRIMKHRFDEKNIEVALNHTDAKNFVYCDYDKINRVLYNLIDNAIKFTPMSGRITISVSEIKNKIQISVRDTGIGIAKAEQQNVFSRFYKTDASRGMDKTGSGLGLAIVKEFINEHGETVSINSEVNDGCEFVFTLPKEKEC